MHLQDAGNRTQSLGAGVALTALEVADELLAEASGVGQVALGQTAALAFFLDLQPDGPSVLLGLHSLTSNGLTAAEIARDRFRLREAVEKKIAAHREAERGKAFQAYLNGADLAVDETRAADFRTMMYEPSSLYEGAYKFKKHYFPRVGELEERTREEFACAQYLDDLPEVEYWVRNLPRKPGSFRLLTAEGWFYPDFVARLKDGRSLVVEYKGAHLWDAAAPKRAVGEAWMKRSGGKGVFVMPTDGGLDAIRSAIK